MTLATRCAACGTAFRVVQDQLKVANGWVRCGRCAHVFDASDALFAPNGPGALAGHGRGTARASADTSVVSGPEPADVSQIVDVEPGVSGPEAANMPPTAVDEPAVSEPIAARPAEPQPAGTPIANDDPALGDPPSPSVPQAPDLPQDASAEPPPAPPRWLLAAPVTVQPVVDIGIGSVPTRAPPAVADEAPVDDDGEPDFVDARFNEDLLAGLPGLRDPDLDDADDRSEPRAGEGAVSAPVATAPSDLGQAVGLPDHVPDRVSERGRDHVRHQDPDHALDIEIETAATPPDRAQASSSTDVADVSPAAADTAPAVDAVTPAFLRQRRSGGRPWQRGPARAALIASAALLVLALGLQAALHWRDWLATRWPATAPWLAAACAPTSCRLQPLRQIEDLGVDSTSLAPASADSAALRLSVVLANRGDLPLAAPNVELALTDATGELVARKVLTPSDFHSTVDVLKPGATVRWQTVLLASGEHVAGYTVELFYP